MPNRMPKNDPEQRTLDAAYAPALALHEALVTSGHPCEELENDETSWYFDFMMGERSVSLFLNWTAFEYPPHNYIAVQWHVRRSFWPWVRRRAVEPAVVATAQSALEAALESLPDVDDLRWFPAERFLNLGTETEPFRSQPQALSKGVR